MQLISEAIVDGSLEAIADPRRAKLIERLRALGVQEDNIKVDGIASLNEAELTLLEARCDKLEARGGSLSEKRPNRKQRRAMVAKARKNRHGA